MDVFRDMVLFEGDVIFKRPIRNEISIFDGSGDINTAGVSRLKAANNSPQNVSYFVGGVEGQTIMVLGDGNTTIVNSSDIRTNTGADKLLAAETVYTFTLFDGVWYESN